MDQRAAQRGALLHAAGKLPGKFVALPVEADRGEQRFGARDIFGLVAADAAAMRLDDFERQQQVVQRGAPGQQRRRLKRHAGDLHRLAHRCARDLHAALERKLQAGRELHQGGLAAAGGADDGGEFAAVRRAIDRPSTASVPPGAAIDMADVIERDEGGHSAALIREPVSACRSVSPLRVGRGGQERGVENVRALRLGS